MYWYILPATVDDAVGNTAICDPISAFVFTSSIASCTFAAVNPLSVLS